MADKLKTPIGHVAFHHVFTLDHYGTGKPKFNMTLLWDKETTDLDYLHKALLAERIKKWGTNPDGTPKHVQGLWYPIRDGDERVNLEGFKGCWYCKFTSETAPQVCTHLKRTITAESGEFYDGCLAWARVTPGAYQMEGGQGLSLFLGNVQKMGDDEPFVGRSTADEDFDIEEELQEEIEKDADIADILG
jgi:hypothetical protein